MPDNQQLLMIFVAATLAVSVFILLRQEKCEGYTISAPSYAKIGGVQTVGQLQRIPGTDVPYRRRVVVDPTAGPWKKVPGNDTPCRAGLCLANITKTNGETSSVCVDCSIVTN